MGRLFSCVILSLMLLPAAKQPDYAQPVFFSLLFPQLVPGAQADAAKDAAEEEAMLL